MVANALSPASNGDKFILSGTMGDVLAPRLHDFGEAIRRMRLGIRQSRVGWNGKGMWLALQVPDEHSKMRRPYIYMSDAQGLLVPWLASQTDMLAEDWCDAPATATA